MRRSRTISALLSIVLLHVGLASVASGQADGINEFGFDMYAELRKTPGNVIFSPLSLSAALAMTYAGAAGVTAVEMAAVLHIDPTDSGVHEEYGALLRALESGAREDSYQLSIGNRLWGQRGYPFLDSFLAMTRDHYGAPLEEVDFGNADHTARTINAWIEKQTARRIKNLIDPAAIDDSDRLILTNAVYFKGSWADPFEMKSTKTEPFHVDRTTTRDVEMMKRGGNYSVAEFEGLSILQLPYVGEALAMVAFLPDSIDGLARLEAQLSSTQVDAWLADLHSESVRAEIPRFRTTSTFSLNDPLARLGMTSAFHDGADFSGMNGLTDLYISLVTQKAFVEVSESGTEAAAATSVWGTMKGVHRGGEIPVFRADHPFVFLIRDQASGAILFLGRFVGPAQSSD